MSRAMRRRAGFQPCGGIAVTLLLLLLPACAHTPNIQEARASFGRVGIYTLPLEEVSFKAPTSGKAMGAGKGALGGAAASIGGGAAYGGPWGLVLGIVLAPVFSVGGLVYGAVVAEPADKVHSWQEAVDRAVAGIDPVSELREGILEKAGNRGLEVTAVESVPLVNGQPDYSSLDALGINTLVEAEWLYCGLEGQGIDPEMQFRMSVGVRVIRTKDRAEIYSTTLGYSGPKKTFAQWAGSPVALRKQVGLGASDISAQAVEMVFFYTAPTGPWYYRLLNQDNVKKARPAQLNERQEDWMSPIFP